MIEFSLDGLHPSYDRILRDTYCSLDMDYPGVLHAVELYSKEGDESMGSACQAGLCGGVIKLNRFWFGEPISQLRDAARSCAPVRLAGCDIALPWHGDMEEPLHVLTHEFGHCLSDIVTGWREFITPHLIQSRLDPANCRPPSGYGMSTGDEFWSDSFAAMRLGYDTEMSRLMDTFLREHYHA